jgi:hypothetical protein
MNHNCNIVTVLHGGMIQAACATTVDLVDVVL